MSTSPSSSTVLRGFARLSEEERRELGRKGGSNATKRYVLPAGEKASEAGRKGAEARWGKKAAKPATAQSGVRST